MAQQAETGIARAGKRTWGYDPAQVDAFLQKAHELYDSEGARLTQADIQNASFDAVKNGYVIAQVDAALARLERAVADKQTTWEISQKGRVAWKAATEDRYHAIARHAGRAPRERFSAGKPKHPSYDRKQVDRLIERVVDKAATCLGMPTEYGVDGKTLDGVTAASVSNSLFTQRSGRKGYDEREVDYFLSACTELLSRIESYDRVSDYLNADDEHAQPAPATVPVPPAEGGVTPLFAPETQRQVPPAVPAPPAADDAPQSFAPSQHESFDALHEAEQHLFTAPAATPSAPATPTVATASAAVTAPAPAATPSAPAPVPAAPSFTPTTQSTRPAWHMPASTDTPAASSAPSGRVASSGRVATSTPIPPAVPAPAPAPVPSPAPAAETTPAPSASMPTLAMPAVPPTPAEQTPVVPEVHIPELKQPSLNTSDFSFAPSVSFDMDLPDLSFPTFDTPADNASADTDGKKAQ